MRKIIQFGQFPAPAKAAYDDLLFKQVEPLFGSLKSIFPDINFVVSPVFRSEPQQVYKDDGNTLTEGTSYSAWWMVPLFREALDFATEYSAYYHGTGDPALYLSWSICLRDSDQQIARRSDGGSVSLARLNFDHEREKSQVRIANSFANSLGIHSFLPVARIALLIKQIREDMVIFQQAENAWNAEMARVKSVE